MSILDSFFSRGFKAAKCKTLLKLTAPRIKLLRNRRTIQLKNMRRDIAKLLETGQEASARIQVEHIIREEKMMAAQEILELYCELIAVRLPIIEAQSECPLDLKEAISSICFAAPRCADLPELQQVLMQFATKYGKEFVSAAAELRPDCGVSRQIIELLSVRAPSAEVKLKLLKEIAEEHELDWDPADTESEFFKPHEDLLDGPQPFVSGSKLPLPEEKHDETLYSAPDPAPTKHPDSVADFDTLDFPEVPTVSVRPSAENVSTPSLSSSGTVLPDPELDNEPQKHWGYYEYTPQDSQSEPEERSVAKKDEFTGEVVRGPNSNQYVPFITPSSVRSASISTKQTDSPALSETKSDMSTDLQNVIEAAQAAAESAERAAAAARSAASLAQIRVAELTEKKNSQVHEITNENPFHTNLHEENDGIKKPYIDHQNSVGSSKDARSPAGSGRFDEDYNESEFPDFDDKLKLSFDSTISGEHEPVNYHQPQRLVSADDESLFSYPNLFTSQNSTLGSGTHSFTDNLKSSHDL